MKYRLFGPKIAFRPSALGFGCMRMPFLNGDMGQVDESEAIRMIRYAIDHGVNYFDSAYPYHRGNSEVVLGKALKGGYREKVKTATKMPMWLVKEPADLDKYFFEQLERLQDTHIDFYLLHALDEARWQTTRNVEALDWMERMKSRGLISHIGFSFHDQFDVLKDIIDTYDGWEFCQIQYNYMDVDLQAGTKGLQYAAAKGLGVIVMEPIRGGSLAQIPPEAVKRIWDSAPSHRTPADWALQWAWNQPEVSTVLSGMSSMQQVLENIESADRSGIGTLSDKEVRLVSMAREEYKKLAPVSCTACAYCMPCPKGVDIPFNFEMYSDAIMYNMLAPRKRMYSRIPAEKRAGGCESCGVCEQKCPQKLPIRTLLADVHSALGEDPK